MLNKIKHSCSCIIEFIKLVVKSDKMLGKPSILSLFPTMFNGLKNISTHVRSSIPQKQVLILFQGSQKAISFISECW